LAARGAHVFEHAARLRGAAVRLAWLVFERIGSLNLSVTVK